MDIRALKSYYGLKREVQYLEEKISTLRERQTSIRSSSDFNMTPGGSESGDKIGDSVAMISDMQAIYESKVFELSEKMKEIEQAIEVLDPIERIIIRARYIDGEYIESICGIIGYGYRHTKRLHGIALKKLLEN